VNGHVDKDCKRPRPKTFFGDRMQEINLQTSHRDAKSGAWFESQRNTAIGWGDRLKQVLKNTLPSKL